MRWSSDDVCPGMGSTRKAARASVIESLKARCTGGVYLRYAGKKQLQTSENLAALLPPATHVAAATYPLCMARTRTVFPRDRGLQTRMLLTFFLLGALYVAFAGVLFAAGAGIGIMVVILAGLSLGQLFLSDKLALQAMGAKVVSPDQAPGLHAMIERLCIQADLPKPRIAVAQSDVPNAFALGRSQKSATVCATTAIIETLEPHELEGVMAHELTHVKNRDVMIMTVASFFASIAAAITQFGFFFGGGFGGGDDDGDGPGFIVVLLASMVVYAISFM